MSQMLEIGKIVNTHGLKGELRVTPWCDGIEIFETVKRVTICDNVYKITAVRPHKASYIVSLSGIDDINKTKNLINSVICADRADLPELSENTYYIEDLIGMNVVCDEKCIGKITDVFSSKSSDVYTVKLENGKDILFPAIKQVVKSIDISREIMTVELTEEYFDEN